MALVTVDDVQSRSGVIFTPEERALVSNLIDDVQGDIEAYLNRPVEVQTVDEFHSLPPFQTNLPLSATPVLSVTSLSVNGVALTSDQYWVQRWGITMSNWGYSALILNPGSWLAPTATYEIVYTGGLDGTKIQAIKNVLMRVVLREKAKTAAGDAERLGYSQVRVEDFEYRLGNTSGTKSPDQADAGSLRPDDMKMIGRYRKRTVRSDAMVAPDPGFQSYPIWTYTS